MTREEREALAQRICNFFRDAANKSVKTTVNFFKKQKVPQSTIYYTLKKYLQHETMKDLLRSGRPFKLSNKKINCLVESVNNQCGLSQRKLARRFGVHQSTISRNLRRRTSVVIRKRKKAPKMNSMEQETRAKKNCGKLYRTLVNDCDIIMDDEKYFKLSGNNVLGNQYFYSTDPSTAPSDVKFQKKAKFEEKVLVWIAISSRGISSVYVHKSKEAIRQGTYLTECIDKRLLPFIEKHHSDGNYLFWPDLATSHYSNVVQQRLKDNHVPYVLRTDNPPNVPQARPVEQVWTLLERKIYENNWEAKNIDCLARRIKQKAKELDQDTLRRMICSVRKKLFSMWRKGLYSVV